MINRAEQTIDKRHEREHARVARELNALKTRQLNSAENLVIEEGETLTSTFTLNGGTTPSVSTQIFYASTQPTKPRTMMAEIQISLFLHSFDQDHLWPNGNALTDDDKLTTIMYWWRDWMLSDPSLGLHVFPIMVQHATQFPDTIQYFLAVNFLTPKTELS